MPYPPQGGYPPQGYQQSQYPPQGYHQQGYPSQQGYGGQGGPPHGGYPQGASPQQGQYNQGHPQAQQPPSYPHQAPPQQAPYGDPSHSPYPQQQGYPPPSQLHYGLPSSGQYPPHQAYGQPPPAQQGPYGVPLQYPYGAPSPQGYGAPQPTPATPPSPGYIQGQSAHVDMSMQADACRKAMKGMGTDEAALIRALAHVSPLEIPTLKQSFMQRHHRNIENDVEKEVSGYFEMCLISILRGPLQQDVWCLNKALKGAGTKEDLLNEVLIGRSNADINAIKQAYHQTYHRSLEKDVKDDLSMKTERLFSMILSATRQEDSAPVMPPSIDADVSELHRCTEARAGAEQLTVCSILSNRSDAQIRAIAHTYEHKYRRSLEKVFIADFSGHMEDSLVQMVRCGTDRAMRDAINIEECMAGAGTKDEMLIIRIVKLHWNPAHVQQVKGAYKAKFGRDLIARIKGETSGDYERCLVAMLA